MSKLETSAEKPVQVRRLNQLVKDYIKRLGQIWVEGEIAQVNSKPSWRLSYITLHDTSAEFSVSVTCSTAILYNNSLRNGDRVVVLGRPAFYVRRGQFSLWATEWRPVGLGQLLARLEQLRQALAAEGLFNPRLRRPLLYLLNKIGLITGRGSAAEHDVLSVAGARWPETDFRVINTIVQGAKAVPEIIGALAQLDADPETDVIIITRSGGDVEDLLPFSDEALIRVVSKVTTLMVSVVGHEPDTPLLDYVADLRAITPTDVAKKTVPDAVKERRLIVQLRERSSASLRRWVDHEVATLRNLASRPVLRDPFTPVRVCGEFVTAQVDRLRFLIHHSLEREEAVVSGLRGKVSALGPSATLARGYAIVQVQLATQPESQIVTSIADAPMGSQLRIRVSDGSISVATLATKPANQ